MTLSRIFNTYGRACGPTITQALRNSELTIYGDGSQTRSFCYIDDLVEGLLRLASYERPLPRPINLGNPTELTVSELARKVQQLTGCRSRIVEKPCRWTTQSVAGRI